VLRPPNITYPDSASNTAEQSIQSGSEPIVFIGVFPADCVRWDGKEILKVDSLIAGHTKTTLVRIPKPPPPVPIPVIPEQTTAENAVFEFVDETIKSWSELLPLYLADRRYKLFDAIVKEIELLLLIRRQLSSGLVTQSQRQALRKQVNLVLNQGNALQQLPLVIRHPDRGHVPVVFPNQKGWVVTPLRLFVMQLAVSYL